MQMLEKKTFAGDRLKRLRARRGITQVALAQKLRISPSYLNQIESDQRPLTARLLRALTVALDVDDIYFVDSDDLRRVSHLREALADPAFRNLAISPEALAAAVRVAPEFGDAFLALYRSYALQEEQLQGARLQAPPRSRSPYDEVRDWVQSQQNHFASLDHAAEQLFEDSGFRHTALREDFTRYLRDKHHVIVGGDTAMLERGMFWRLERKQLFLTEDASVESKVFWLAHVIGQLEQREIVEREIRRAQLSTKEASGLARIMLANYFAGALILPYRRFYEQARAVKYDLQRLQSYFGASFEQVCHRLSTMQRPNLPGIPFYFAKTDIAGNILKRSSATRFQFAQFGGPCPLWNVYRAFAHPGEILVQLAITPDQVSYLNIARTVGRGGGFYLSHPRSVAVVLGCEVRFGAETVYAAGLDLTNPAGADPIGPGCRACERTNCRHRSVPPLGHVLDVGTAARGVVPYQMHLANPAT